MAILGILFDIDALGGKDFASRAYRILFRIARPARCYGCKIYHCKTSETLAGNCNHFCIAVESFDENKIDAIRNTLATRKIKGLLPPESRFLNEFSLCREPLELSAEIDSRGRMTFFSVGWVSSTWAEEVELAGA